MHASDGRQNIIKCCLDHKTSVRARRRLFIIVYKCYPSAMILSNIKYFSNLPPRIFISLKINMSGWCLVVLVVLGSCGDQIRLDNLVPVPSSPQLRVEILKYCVNSILLWRRDSSSAPTMEQSTAERRSGAAIVTRIISDVRWRRELLNLETTFGMPLHYHVETTCVNAGF